MDTKLLLRIICIFLVFSMCSPVFAKKDRKAKPQNFIIEQTAAGEDSDSENENPDEAAEVDAESTWQELEWIEETPAYVLKYEIIIEQKNSADGQWSEVRHLETADNKSSIKIEPSLDVGQYRFKVITVDLIGLKDVESEWEEFNIYKAFSPRVTSVSVGVNKTSTIYFDEYNDGYVSISGRNLFAVKEKDTDITFTSYSLVRGKGSSVPLELIPLENKNNRDLSFKLDLETLDTGVYNFIATDASGLKSEVDSRNQLVVKFKKAVDFEISAGYFCPVILFDDTINQYMGSKIWPISLMAKMTLVPIKRRFGYFGLGLEGYYTRMSASMDGYDIDGNLAAGYGTIVYQHPFILKKNNRHIATFEAHAGAGVDYFMNYQFHFPHDIESEKLNSINLSAVAGVGLQLYITSRLFVETNIDFCMSFVKDMKFGVVRPGILIGWQF